MRKAVGSAILASVVFHSVWAGSAVDYLTNNRTTPPIINTITPLGLTRGITTQLTVEGYNLGGTSGIYFSEFGLEARIVAIKELPDLPEPEKLSEGGLPSTIDLGPLPPRHQVIFAVEVNSKAEVGLVRFRLHTPLGSSPEGKVLVEPNYTERVDTEPNDRLQHATKTLVPAILAGTISRPGDKDYYRLSVQAGDEFTFQESARVLGSALKPVIAILSSDHSVLREFKNSSHETYAFSYRFKEAGTYWVRVSDYEKNGSEKHFYRIKIGSVPLVMSTYPLGLRRGDTVEISVQGFNLGRQKVTLHGQPSPEDEHTLRLRPETPFGKSFNEIKLDLGDYPEVDSTGANTSPETAQLISTPVTVNGHIAVPVGQGPVANYFRFHANKRQRLILEVKADQLGSALDSQIEVLDVNGQPIERALVRAVAETHVTLRDFDSITPGIRIQSWQAFGVGDYLMIGGEINRVARLPRGPDEDVLFESFPPVQASSLNFLARGQRLAFFGTSPEVHANHKPVYKVEIHDPGKPFSSNGLPLVSLPYSNNDGGAGYGKDSRLEFTAPTDSEYIVRIGDVLGSGGNHHSYRLTLRPPRPNFNLSLDPPNPNIPVGGRVLVNVLAFREDDFEDPIKIIVEDLPKSLHATEAVILAGEHTTTLILSADANARLDRPVAFRIKGSAKIGGREVVHWANPGDELNFIALMPPSDIIMITESREVVLRPGGEAQITVKIRRQNGFEGRVPVLVRNLAPDLDIPALGLNGVLITEQENSNTFLISALPTAQPIQRWLYVAGKVETRSPSQNEFAGEPILLKIKPPGEPTQSESARQDVNRSPNRDGLQ